MEEINEIIAMVAIVEVQCREVNRPDNRWEVPSARKEGNHEEINCCEEKPEEEIASEENDKVDDTECNVEEMCGNFWWWEYFFHEVRERREADNAEYH